MRIVITTDAVGGVWDQARRLAGALAPSHDVLLVVAGPVAARLDPVPGVRMARLEGPLEWMPGGAQAVPDVHRRLREIVEGHEAQLVHANAYGHVLPEVPTVLSAHSSLHGWWDAVHPGTDAPEEWEAYARVVAQAVADAACVLAPTRAMLDEVARYASPQAARVVHNGIDPPSSTGLRRPYVLSGGRLWDPAKGFDVLARAAARMPWPVHVTGDVTGPTGQRLEMPGLKVLGRLRRERLDTEYAEAGLYVNPARYEPFGLGALEAAVRGCPIVLPDLPSQRELWDGAAMFHAPGDAEVLADVVAALAFDPAARRRLAASAQQRAGCYTIEAMVEGHLAAYEETGAQVCTT